MFGHRNLYLTTQQWLERHTSGRLRPRSAPMRSAMGTARNAKAVEFEDKVAARAEAAGAAAVRRRVLKIGQLDLRRVDGANLGDIDVLIVTADGVVLIVEAKAFEVARTPRELRHEVDALLRGAKSAVCRTQARADALRRHRRQVEIALGLTDRPRRRFDPLVVTDRRLLAGYLNNSGVPVLSLNDLEAMVST